MHALLWVVDGFELALIALRADDEIRRLLTTYKFVIITMIDFRVNRLHIDMMKQTKKRYQCKIKAINVSKGKLNTICKYNKTITSINNKGMYKIIIYNEDSDPRGIAEREIGLDPLRLKTK